MKILWMGYDIERHHSRQLYHSLVDLGYDVDFVDMRQFLDKYLLEYTIPRNIDYVFCAQAEYRIKFKKKRNSTKIILYAAELYWSPGPLNPDYIISMLPEQISRFKFCYPELFHNLKSYKNYFNYIVTKDLPPLKSKRKYKGIHFIGPISTGLVSPNAKNGGGHFKQYRDAYSIRRRFMIENCDLVVYHSSKPYKEYLEFLTKCEAVLNANADLAYLSRRPAENAIYGAINVIYIRDNLERKYNEEAGWFHMINCFMFSTREELRQFNKLPEENKEIMRINARTLVEEEYNMNKFWTEIMGWLDK